MPAFEKLKASEIDSILEFIDYEEKPVAIDPPKNK